MSAALQSSGVPVIAPARSAALDDAVSAIRQGIPVLLMDATDRKDEGYVVLAAELATARSIGWMVRYTSGLICAPMPDGRADELDLPSMVYANKNPRETAFTVAVDAAEGVTTGISATDRAHTLRVLAKSDSRPSDLTRPGHVIPLRARPGGVVERPGHTEAAVDLCTIAGLPAVAAVAAIVGGGDSSSHTMASRQEVRRLGAQFDLPVLDIAELITHRLHHGDGFLPRVSRREEARLSTAYGDLISINFLDNLTGVEHTALLGTAAPGPTPLVSIHGPCASAGLVHSDTCACREEFDSGLRRIASAGGVAIRIAQKNSPALSAHSWRREDEAAGAAILAELGLTSIRLLPGPCDPDVLAVSGIDASDDVGP
ncbi:3,4-dihydroxy-2-butanone-4-phosphate synthase [Rhodococcus pyridinivorans]|uniref:3,4-dihydroxy-2-butanone-4-phosphate synthase n=1 Tax=Rhodococcus pyridinivorans TaxID=103816 RepID=UPI0039B39598